jgi:arsenite methyltransferase
MGANHGRKRMTQAYLTRTAPKLDRGRLRAAIEDAYTNLALHPERRLHFICGAPLARRLGYTQTLLDGVPREAIASFSGVGNPFRMDGIERGADVLDIGCGSGVDVLVASRLVGPRGSVVGLDMTAAMVERAQDSLSRAGASNARIEWGHAESLPLPDSSVDVVVSNGVVALTPDKHDTFREIARVLRPGGRLCISDVVVQWRIPPYVSEATHLWTECIAGATWLEDYPALLRGAGFEDPRVVEIFDVFAGTEVERNSSFFRARGANVSACMPE